MWPFTGNKPGGVLDQPRYKTKPVLLLFEFYVLDCIGLLSAEKRKGVEAMNLQKMFNTSASEWKSALMETLRLSSTIDTAILESWYKEKEANPSIDAEEFSRKFADEYFRDGSQVDVWADGALEAAKKYIGGCRAKGM